MVNPNQWLKVPCLMAYFEQPPGWALLIITGCTTFFLPSNVSTYIIPHRSGVISVREASFSSQGMIGVTLAVGWACEQFYNDGHQKQSSISISSCSYEPVGHSIFITG